MFSMDKFQKLLYNFQLFVIQHQGRTQDCKVMIGKGLFQAGIAVLKAECVTAEQIQHSFTGVQIQLLLIGLYADCGNENITHHQLIGIGKSCADIFKAVQLVF